MAIDDTIAAALSAELESNMDTQYAVVDMPANVIAATLTWDGSSTVLTSDTSEVSVAQYIRLNSDGVWYKISSITPDTNIVVSDAYSVGSFPSGSDGSSVALVDPPEPVSGTGSLDTFAQGIADAFSSTPHELPVTTVAGLPSASPAGRMVYVSDASGGAVPAFSDGSVWRRVDTRAIVT
jgi:hypothetical protein